MKILKIAALLLCISLSACSSENDAQKALKSAGYTDVTITGYSWFSCGKGDTFATGFVATGPTGVRTEGVVCSAWLKGSTIRTF